MMICMASPFEFVLNIMREMNKMGLDPIEMYPEFLSCYARLCKV